MKCLNSVGFRTLQPDLILISSYFNLQKYELVLRKTGSKNKDITKDGKQTLQLNTNHH